MGKRFPLGIANITFLFFAATKKCSVSLLVRACEDSPRERSLFAESLSARGGQWSSRGPHHQDREETRMSLVSHGMRARRWYDGDGGGSQKAAQVRVRLEQLLPDVTSSTDARIEIRCTAPWHPHSGTSFEGNVQPSSQRAVGSQSCKLKFASAVSFPKLQTRLYSAGFMLMLRGSVSAPRCSPLWRWRRFKL